MASIDDISKTVGLWNQIGKTADESVATDNRKQAAAQAMDALKRGAPISEVYAPMVAADPSFAQQIIPHISSIDPAYAQQLKKATTTGELEGESAFGSTKRQITDANNDSKLSIADIKSRAADDVLKSWYNRASGDTLFGTKKEVKGVLGADNKVHPLEGATQDTPATTETPKPPKLSSDEVIDSTGKKIRLNTNTVKGINKDVDSFNNETKDLRKKLTSLEEAKHLVDANIEGLGGADKILFIKSLVSGAGKIAQQEIQSVSGDQNSVVDRINQIAERAKTGKLPPEMQAYMRTALDVVQKASLDEYNQTLHSRAAQTGSKFNVDPSVIMQKFAPEMPTHIQQKIYEIRNLPKEDQEAIDWAHGALLSDHKNQKALQILRMHGL